MIKTRIRYVIRKAALLQGYPNRSRLIMSHYTMINHWMIIITSRCSKQPPSTTKQQTSVSHVITRSNYMNVASMTLSKIRVIHLEKEDNIHLHYLLFWQERLALLRSWESPMIGHCLSLLQFWCLYSCDLKLPRICSSRWNSIEPGGCMFLAHSLFYPPFTPNIPLWFPPSMISFAHS